MHKWRLSLLTLLAGAAALGCTASSGQPPDIDASTVAFVPQGWTRREREAFWFTSQGSQILSYDIFVNLERADTEELFRSPTHMAGLGYIPWPTTARNPAALPIGFVRDDDKIGLTCAACHTNVARHDGRDILIDGAPTLADFTGFMTVLVNAMRANQENAKFQRLAARVFGEGADPVASAALLARLQVETDALAARQARNGSSTTYGYGRLDAFGQIFNEVAAHDLGLPDNARAADAPVSYPFLWGTPQSDVVQWNGVADNRAPVGSLTRNVGEVLGVFGRLEMGDGPGYPSSVRLRNLAVLENHVEKLWRPSWDEAGLPSRNVALSARGESVYAANCRGCHMVLGDPTARSRQITARMVPLAEIGTDPAMAMNSLDVSRATGRPVPRLTGRLEGRKKRITETPRFEATAPALEIVGNGVQGALLADVPRTLQAVAIDRLDLTQLDLDLPRPRASSTAGDDQDFETILRSVPPDSATPARLDAYDRASRAAATVDPRALSGRLAAHAGGASQGGEADDPARLLAYKARPLDGIWATAPYLHNGSVPTLADLLLPSNERPDQFRVGSRQLDTVRVGFASSPEGDAGFVLGTGMPGNSNAGHEYGTSLPEEDKAALVEYLKGL